VLRIANSSTASTLPPRTVVTWLWGGKLASGNNVQSNGTEWSEHGDFNSSWAESFATGYPDMYMLQEGLPFLSVPLAVTAHVLPPPGNASGQHAPPKATVLPVGVNGTWLIELEASSPDWSGGPLLLPAQLGSPKMTSCAAPCGATLGIMLSLNRTAVPAVVQTYFQFVTSRYGPAFDVPAVKTPPRRFPITDRLVGGGDSDPRTRAYLVNNMVRIGLSGLVHGLYIYSIPCLIIVCRVAWWSRVGYTIR
jgi:hypothetical protein